MVNKIPPEIRQTLGRDYQQAMEERGSDISFFKNVQKRVQEEQPEIYEYIKEYLNCYFPDKGIQRRMAREGMLFLYEIMRRHQETQDLEEDFKRMFSKFDSNSR